MIQVHHTARSLGAAVLAAVLAVPAAAQQPPAPPAPPPAAPAAAAQVPADDDKFSLNMALDGAPLEDMIELVSRHTNKIFLYQDRIKQVKIYSIGRRQFRGKDLYAIFQSILELNGFALVTIARDTPAEVVKVVESRNTRRYVTPTFSAEELKLHPERMTLEEEVITVTYGLRYSSAREVSNALRPLLDPNTGGQIIGIEKVEVLVITDFAPNVQRLVRVVELMDVPGPQLVWEVIKLEWADPDELVGKIGQFMEGQVQAAQQGGGIPVPQVRLVSYARTRSIIVQASESQVKDVKALVSKLDVQLLIEPSRLHFYKLKHTDAEKLVETVNAVLQVRPNLGSDGSTSPSDGPQPMPSPGQPRPSAGPRVRNTSSRNTGDGTDQATAIADLTTNAVIIVSSESEWREIEKLVARLDVRRPQVLIETAIIEVTATDNLNIGAELATIDSAAQNSTRGFAATSFGLSSLVDQNGVPITAQTPGVPAGRIPNLSAQGVSIGLTRDTPFKIPLLLNLIGTASDTNVLSFPRLLTNDNEEATVKVGEAVPTSNIQNAGQSGVNPIAGFQGFQEAGLRMTIKPHISEGDYLNLEMNLTIDQFVGNSTDPSLPPPKVTRELKNRITVPNHKTIVIGGLTSSRLIESTTKIPLLGDIPLLGLLFQRLDRRETKTHLYIFLTPHILDDDQFRDIGALSRAHLKDAAEQGINPGGIDQHWREAFRAETWPGADEGVAPTRLQYRPAGE